MKKFALVLSGGGFKGAFQIGALRHLSKNWHLLNPDVTNGGMKFDVVAGVSVGSLNGVLTACDELEALERLWLDIGANVENIYTSDFIDTTNRTEQVKIRLNFNKIRQRFLPNTDLRISLGQGLGMLFSKSRREKFITEFLNKAEKDFYANFDNFRALADNTPLRERLDDLVRIDKVKDCIYKCGFVSLNNGSYYAIDQTSFASDEDFRKGILASTAMPIVWEPVDKIKVRLNGGETVIDQSVDGGIRNVSPLADVIDEINADEAGHEYVIVIINCNSGIVDYKSYEKSNIAGIAMRALQDIAITEIFNNDLVEFLRINDIIDQVRTAKPDLQILNYNLREGRTSKVLRPFKAIIIQTDPGVLGDALVANEVLNERRIQHGEQKAGEALRLFNSHGRSVDVV